jgi:hypothetical protein
MRALRICSSSIVAGSAHTDRVRSVNPVSVVFARIFFSTSASRPAVSCIDVGQILRMFAAADSHFVQVRLTGPARQHVPRAGSSWKVSRFKIDGDDDPVQTGSHDWRHSKNPQISLPRTAFVPPPPATHPSAVTDPVNLLWWVSVALDVIARCDASDRAAVNQSVRKANTLLRSLSPRISVPNAVWKLVPHHAVALAGRDGWLARH